LVRLGWLGKAALLDSLLSQGVRLNRAAEALFEDPRFAPPQREQELEARAFSVRELGLAEGGTYRNVVERARDLGFIECPLELGAYLRLELADQEDVMGAPPAEQGAPAGAITVASAPLGDEEDTPRGFYLLRREGVAWLRGYWASSDHVWRPQDVLLFCRSPPSQSAPWRS
jgi:hypothetical protein